MGRLKGRGLPSRLGPQRSRLRAAPADDAERQRRRDGEVRWRRWYKTARWQRLRREVLLRDAYICRQTGVMLQDGRDAPNSAVVDHIRPHRGDPAMFWDPENLQSVAKSWHDREKQKAERSGLG